MTMQQVQSIFGKNKFIGKNFDTLFLFLILQITTNFREILFF